MDKNEQDGSITFNLESSFSRYLRLTGFLEEDKLQILRQLWVMAAARNIRFINSGELASTMA